MSALNSLTGLFDHARRVNIKINLVPKDPFFNTPFGKLLKWALSVGRYIVIFTELVVILSFITRFSLDRQVTDLNEKINQSKIIIESYGELETSIRSIQKQLDIYEQVSQETNIADIFPVMSRITPRDVRLNELAIKQNEVVFSGQALSQSAFNTLVTNLELSPEFFEIYVSSIEGGDERNPGLKFSIRVTTKDSSTTSQNQGARKT